MVVGKPSKRAGYNLTDSKGLSLMSWVLFRFSLSFINIIF